MLINLQMEIIKMFIAKFESFGVSVSLLDFLFYLINPYRFVKRISKKLNRDFTRDIFEGVHYYGKK